MTSLSSQSVQHQNKLIDEDFDTTPPPPPIYIAPNLCEDLNWRESSVNKEAVQDPSTPCKKQQVIMPFRAKSEPEEHDITIQT